MKKILISNAIIFSVLLIYCTTSESVLEMLDDTNEYEQSLDELSEIIMDESESPEIRMFALRSAGIIAHDLGSENSRVRSLSEALDIAINDSDPYVQAWAAWAIGNTGNLDCLDSLFRVLSRTTNEFTAYNILETIWRLYGGINSSEEQCYRCLESLITYESNQQGVPPNLYYTINDLLTNISTLVRLMSESCTRYDLGTCYGIVLDAFGYLRDNYESFTAAYNNYSSSLESLISASVGTLDFNDKYISLMLIWMIGNNLNDSVYSRLAEIACEKIRSLVEDENPGIRLLTVWTMIKLQLYSSNAKLGLNQLLEVEADEQILEVISVFYDGEQKDEIQLLFGL